MPVILVTTIITFGYNNFTRHKDIVIKQQQEHLLTMAKSISRSLDVFINYKSTSLSLLSKDQAIIRILKNKEIREDDNEYEEVLKIFFQRYNDEIENLKLFTTEGELIYQYPLEGEIGVMDDFIINNLLDNKETFITKEYLSKDHQYSIDILQPIVDNNKVIGILLNTINLNKVYEKLIYPIKPGKMGYAMAKNTLGFIVMHPVIEEVGIESLKIRKERYPEFDWRELEELSRKQVEEGEGYFIYNSKWWQDTGKKLAKKINAYTTFEKGDISWIISVQMDYKEIEGPIRGTLIDVSLISLIIIISFGGIFYIIFKINKEKKELEVETRYLKELNKAWEELIKSEARLKHSQKLETIGTLTTGIAHEFNNLLSPILGYSEILLQDIDGNNTNMYEDILEINKSALKAREIIERILAFSREGNMVSKFEELEVGNIINESIKLIKPILPHNIDIIIDLNNEGIIIGDSTELQQVLINLYTNSYQAMKNKGGILEISTYKKYINGKFSTELELPGGDYLVIQVRDTGIGMDEETLVHIFEYFFTTKITGEGTGLGLAVVSGIIEKHKGKIIVESQLNLGTSVKIYLPIIGIKHLSNS